MLEQALTSLLRIRGRQEMDDAVLNAVCLLTSAASAALYEEGGGGYRLRAHCGKEPARWRACADQVGGIAGGLEGRPAQALAEHPSAARNAWLQRCAATMLQPGDGPGLLLVLGPRQGGEPWGGTALERLERVLGACGVALHNAAVFDHLNSLVLVDPLTGCYNRRGFDEHLKVETVRARRYRRPISLLVLDVDHFKQVNDRFGHLVGDAVLRRVGEVLSAQFRTTDVVCRFGGDEFAVIFPETPRDDVRRLAERLRMRIAAMFPSESLPTELTVSLGIAGFPDDAEEPETLLGAADRALYLAKVGGRNRVASA